MKMMNLTEVFASWAKKYGQVSDLQRAGIEAWEADEIADAIALAEAKGKGGNPAYIRGILRNKYGRKDYRKPLEDLPKDPADPFAEKR